MVMSCNTYTCDMSYFVNFVTSADRKRRGRVKIEAHGPFPLEPGQNRGKAMPADSGKKLFVGPRFRRIRQQLGLSQTQIAEGLGISPSYINLIERNQRPVTAQILL